MDRKNYFRNVAKSVNYMVDDLLKATSPATYNLKNAVSSVKSAQQEMREMNIEAARLQRTNKPVMPQINPRDILTNAVNDAKTGKFYNKSRIKNMDDDFDKANGNSIFSMGIDDILGNLGQSQASLENKVATQTRVNVSLTKSQIMADHHNMLVTNEFNKARHIQMMQMSDVINTNVINLVEFNNNKLAPFLDQSIQFYNDSLFEQRKTAMLMEEMRDMYKSSFSPEQNNLSTLMDVSSMEKIIGGGTFDFGAYYKLVGSNLKKKLNPEKPDYITPTSMHKLAASPISQTLKAAFDWFAPKSLTDGLKSLEQTISGIPSALIAGLMNIDKSKGFDKILEKFTTSAIGKFFDLDKGGNKNILKGGITQWIREVFGLNQETKFDISKFNKGPMQYNGIANRAITTVIPSLLGKIYTTLAGIQDDIIVDYDKGGALQWASDKRQDFANKQENAIVSSMSDFNTEVLSMIKNINTSNETRDELVKNLADINKWIAKGNKLDYRKEGFADELESGIAGLTKERANLFVSLFNAMPDSVMNKLPFMQHMSQLALSHLARTMEANADSNGLVMSQIGQSLLKDPDITKRILDIDFTGKKKGPLQEANERLIKSRKDLIVGFEDNVKSTRNKMEEAPIAVLKSIRRILVEGLIVYPVKKIPMSIRNRSKKFSDGDIIRNANDVNREDASIKAKTSEQTVTATPEDDLNDPEIGKLVASRIEVNKALKDPNSAVEEQRTTSPKTSFLSKLLNAPYNAASYMIHGFNKIVNLAIYGDEQRRKNPIIKWFEEKKEKAKKAIKDKVKETRDKFLASETGQKLVETKNKVRDWFKKPDEEGNNFASFWSDLWGKTKNVASDVAEKAKEVGQNFVEDFKEGNTWVQGFLFGDKENRKGGLIHKDIQDMWGKIGFNTKKFGSVLGGGSAGYLAGLFLPGGPLLWGMIGATDRFINASDGLKEALFGTPDNPSKLLPPDIARAIPDITKGTGLGIVGGLLLNSFLPGGPVTASIIGGITGAIGGYLKNQNLLQKLLFGNKEKGTKGIFTKVGDLIYDHIGAPIKGWFMKQSALWTRTITKHLLTPIKHALKPIGAAFGKFAKGLANGLMNMLNKATGGAAGWITKKIGQLGSLMFGAARSALMAIPTFASAKARGAVHAVGSGINAVGHVAAKYAYDKEEYQKHYGADSEYRAELNRADEVYKEQMQNVKDFKKQHKQNRKDGIRLSDIRYQEEQQRLAEIEAAETKRQEAEATWKVINSLDELRKAADAAREAMDPAVPKPTGNILAPRVPDPEPDPEEQVELLDAVNPLKAGTTDKISNKVDIVKPTGSLFLPPEEVVEEPEQPKLDEIIKLKPGKVTFNTPAEKIESKTAEVVTKTFSMPKTEDLSTDIDIPDELGKDSLGDRNTDLGPVDNIASKINNFAKKTANLFNKQLVTDENGNIITDETKEIGPVDNIANKVSSFLNKQLVTDENGNIIGINRPNISERISSLVNKKQDVIDAEYSEISESEIKSNTIKDIISNVGNILTNRETIFDNIKTQNDNDIDSVDITKPKSVILSVGQNSIEFNELMSTLRSAIDTVQNPSTDVVARDVEKKELLGNLKAAENDTPDEAVHKPNANIIKPNHIINVKDLKAGETERPSEAVHKPNANIIKPNHIINVKDLKAGENVAPDEGLVKPNKVLSDEAGTPSDEAKPVPMAPIYRSKTPTERFKENLVAGGRILTTGDDTFDSVENIAKFIGSETPTKKVKDKIIDKDNKLSIGDGADDNIIGSSDFEDKYIGKDVRQQIEQEAQNDDNESLNAIKESTSMTAKILAKFTNGDSKDGKKNTLWDFIKGLGGSLISGISNLVTGFFKWGPLIAGGIYALKNFLPYFTGEKTIEDLPADLMDAASHSGAWEVLRRGEKMLGNVYRGGKKIVNKGAQLGAKAVNFVTGGKIGWVDDLAKGAGKGGKNLSTMVAKGIDDGVGGIVKKAANSNIAQKVVSMLDDGLKVLMDNKMIGKFIEPVYKVAKKIFPKIGAKIAKMGATAAAKVAARTVSKATVVAEAALMVNDAVTGFTDYKNILGIPNSSGWDNQMAAVCAVVRFISGFCFGLIPEKWVSELILNLLGRGDELEQLQEEYNQNMEEAGFGDNAEAYAKYENPTFWQKIGSAVGLCDSRREIVQEEIDAIKKQMAELDPNSEEYKRLEERMKQLTETYYETSDTWYETIGNFVSDVVIAPFKRLTEIMNGEIIKWGDRLNTEFSAEEIDRMIDKAIEEGTMSEQTGQKYKDFYDENGGLTNDQITDITDGKPSEYVEPDMTQKEFDEMPGWKQKLYGIGQGMDAALSAMPLVGSIYNGGKTAISWIGSGLSSAWNWVTGKNKKEGLYTGNKNAVITQVHQAKNAGKIDDETYNRYINMLSRNDTTADEVNEILAGIGASGGVTTSPKSVSQMVQLNKESEAVSESINTGVIPNAGAALSLDNEKAYGSGSTASTSKNAYQPITAYKYISSPYGNRDWDGDGKTDEFHDGLDYAAPAGTPIYAYKSGKAYWVRKDGGNNGGWGNHVRIRHNDGYETIYAHASKVNINEGDTVQGGQKIAEVGTTGRSTGNHLHFSIYKQTKDGSRPKYGTGVNPNTFLKSALDPTTSGVDTTQYATQEQVEQAIQDQQERLAKFDPNATDVGTDPSQFEGTIIDQLANEFGNFFTSIFSGKGYTPFATQVGKDDSGSETTPSDSSTTPTDSAPTGNAAKPSATDFLGVASVKYETGAQYGDPAMVSSGANDPYGGISYGIPQFSSKQGSARSFVDDIMSRYPVYNKYFKGKQPGSNEFGTSWKQAAAERGNEFRALQLDYIYDNFYKTWRNGIKNNYGVDIDKDRGLQEMGYSVSVQHGPGSAGQSAKYDKCVGVSSSMSPEQIVDKVFQNRNNLSAVRCQPRWDNELAELKRDYVGKPPIDYSDEGFLESQLLPDAKGGVGTKPLTAEEYQKLNKNEIIKPMNGKSMSDVTPLKEMPEPKGAIPNAGGAIYESMEETLHNIESSINRYYSDMTNSINTATTVDSITKQQNTSGIDFAELMKAVKEIVVNTASTAANVSGLGTVVSQGIDSLAATVSAQSTQQAVTTATAVQAASTNGNNSAINVFNGTVDASRQQISNSMRDRVKRITKGN